MADDSVPPDPFAKGLEHLTELWRSMARVSAETGDTWSKSVLPFILSRAVEARSGMGDELSGAIERMAQGPRLADVVDFDRKLLATFSAWTEMQKKLAAYNVVAARPWQRAAELYQSPAGPKPDDASDQGWREKLGAWTAVAGDELIRNQRSDDFLIAQKELLQAATEFRNRQTEIGESVSKILGLPTQRDFDDVTRQLTELRREVRALSRRVDAAAVVVGRPKASSKAAQ